MENKIEVIKMRIEILIEVANEKFNGEWTHSHELRLARIDGMIDALCILTHKEYYIDENGLHERE